MNSVDSIIISSPIGTTYDFFDVDMSQKELSRVLSRNGWKKDYGNSGVWKRVARWEYLTYYDGLKKGVEYARMRFVKNAAGYNRILNKDVNIYAGMRVSQGMIDVIMERCGYHRIKDMWIKNNA